jgi:hypothetical protein
MDAAVRYAHARGGDVSFAVVDELGRLHSYRSARVVPAASVLKAMLLVAYLRQPSVRARALTDADRRLLAPMIRWSDNGTATTVRNLVGAAALERLARLAGMRHFRVRFPWGSSEITAAGQARFFYRVDRLVPKRHRAYARTLLASVVPSQRWGIPPAKPRGWKIFFKGGWGPGTGSVTHQVALLERGAQRVSLAVLTLGNPSHRYGTETIRGVASRLLRALPAGPRKIAPAAADGHLAWSESSRRTPDRYVVHVQRDGEAPTRIGRGVVGDVDGTTLAYSDGDVRLLDLATGARLPVPARVNSAREERGPSLSGGRLLFGRDGRVILFDRATRRGTRLGFGQPGKVSGRFAVWARCTRATRCRVLRHNSATGRTIAVPNPRGRAQYAPSVSEDGTVYFVESDSILCGARARIWVYSPGKSRRLVGRVAAGRDVAVTDVHASTLFYDRLHCGSGGSSLVRRSIPR